MLRGPATVAVVSLLAGALALGTSGSADANGGSAFLVRSFDYTRTADLEPDTTGGQTLIDFHHWRVTICTPRRARLRIRATVEAFDWRTQRFRFVRRQRAGCTRHWLDAEGKFYVDQSTDSRLRVAWRNQRRRTGWVPASDSAPD